MNTTQRNPADQARAYLDEAVRRRTPGVQYLVVDSSGVRFEYAGGWADIARRMPMDSSITLMAYSMSKTITAVAVLQLVQAGKIDLDAPLERYVPMQPYGPGVTVRGLLAHTAGLPNPIPLRWVHPAAAHAAFDEHAALAAILQRFPRTAAPPGTRYRYSNIGYWLLGEVVAQAAGQPFPDYVRDHVLAPLHTAPGQLGFTIPDTARHAAGYLERRSWLNLLKGFLIDRELIGQREGDWIRIHSHYVNGAAFGGLVGTARGFAAFLQDQLREHSRLLDDTTRALLYTPQTTARGEPVAMTPGWHTGQIDGRRVFFKEGGGGGFHVLMRLYPDQGIATIVLANATAFKVHACLDALDRLFLGS
jgi:CubicO group peptidase (beta-lactamase class C family)